METFGACLEKPCPYEIEDIVFDLPTSVDEDIRIFPALDRPASEESSVISVYDENRSLETLLEASLSDQEAVQKYNNNMTSAQIIRAPPASAATSATRLGINLSLIPPISEFEMDPETKWRSINQIVPATERHPKRPAFYESLNPDKTEIGLFGPSAFNRPSTAMPTACKKAVSCNNLTCEKI